ncbi:MAG: exported protein of unknown function [Ilumatobacteraceae bacterium]|nr:exported protein of unknown function [Ilumatobacteraceae bacterium]
MRGHGHETGRGETEAGRPGRGRVAAIVLAGVLVAGLAGPAASARPAQVASAGPADGPSATIDLALEPHAEQAPAVPSTRADQRSDGLPSDGVLRTQAQDDPARVVTVEVLHDPGRGDAVAAEIVAQGGRVHGPIADVGTEGELPAGAVVDLEVLPGVTAVQQPSQADPRRSGAGPDEQAVTGSEVTLTNADDWQAAGITGAGVKVGIIDSFNQDTWDAAVSSGDLTGQPAGTFCRNTGAACSVWGTSNHGVAVAEIVHEMAPGAQLFIANIRTAADFQAAIDYFQTQGVKVVTRSQTAIYDGPGNGTGPVAAVVDSAVSKGMIYLNAAGNAGGGGSTKGSYWRGSWVDADSDSFLEFSAGDELLATRCWYFNGLRWSDWGANKTDYDVYVYNSSQQLIAISNGNQSTGAATPIEGNNNFSCTTNTTVYIAVKKIADGNGTAGDVLEYMVNGVGLEYWQNPYASSAPMADSANAGALAIGAVDPASGGVIANYSSQGPTNDGRIKPDLSAPSCVSSTSYAPNCFNGTSAATPVVAGAAALALSAGVASTPTGIASYLRSSVVDRGTAGTDNVYGTGELRLPVPAPSTGPAPFANFTDMVNRQYQDFLGRAPTAAERTSWVNQLNAHTANRSSLVGALRTSSENVSNVDPVTRLYSAYFLRIPDAGGLVYWIGKRRKGAKLDTISQSFASSSEFKTRYGSLSNAAFVDLIYHNLFDRNPDPSGKAYWTGKLDNKTKNRGQVMAGFSESNEYKTDQVKPVNAAVGVIFMLKRKPTTSEFASLLSGPGTGASVAEWVFGSGSYAP